MFLVNPKLTSHIENEYYSLGDSGELVAIYYDKLNLDHNQPQLTIRELRNILADYTQWESERKFEIFNNTIERTKSVNEAKIVTKLFQNSLRIGIGEATLEIVLRMFKAKGTKQGTLYMLFKCVKILLASIILQRAEEEVFGHIIARNVKSIKDHIPIIPMQVKVENDASQVRHGLRRRGDEAIWEYNIKGMRNQIHYTRKLYKHSSKLSFFSSQYQNLNNESFGLHKKLLEELDQIEGLDNWVLDSKIAFYDKENNKYIPFEEYILNKEKQMSTNIIPILHVFDIMQLNDQCLLNTAILERKKVLEDKFTELWQKQNWFKLSGYQKVSFKVFIIFCRLRYKH